MRFLSWVVKSATAVRRRVAESPALPDSRARRYVADSPNAPQPTIVSTRKGKAQLNHTTGRSHMHLETLKDLFEHELADLHSAETQLVAALPKIAQAASNEELRGAFEQHLEETRDHVRRLEEIRAQIGSSLSEECKGMRGLIKEGDDIVSGQGDPIVKDAALIAAAQRVEHYEIAAYGTARTLADELDLDDAKDLLDQTLDEEGSADKLLTKIATGGMLKTGINEQARR
jgi:ferritin-like metal-binding protein YciE